MRWNQYPFHLNNDVFSGVVLWGTKRGSTLHQTTLLPRPRTASHSDKFRRKFTPFGLFWFKSIHEPSEMRRFVWTSRQQNSLQMVESLGNSQSVTSERLTDLGNDPTRMNDTDSQNSLNTSSSQKVVLTSKSKLHNLQRRRSCYRSRCCWHSDCYCSSYCNGYY